MKSHKKENATTTQQASHNPLSEPAEPLAPHSYTPIDKKTSWAVLDTKGELIESLSRQPNLRQDPASTTKLWTFYTVLHRIKQRLLPSDFVQRNRELFNKMLVRSDNNAPLEIAKNADEHKSYLHFAEEMTALAKEKGLENSHFNKPNGWLQPGNYSTAGDMARMAYLLHRDFPEAAKLAGQVKAPGIEKPNTGAQILTHGIAFGKTGTGVGNYGGQGRLAYTGAALAGGYVAVAAASNWHERNGLAIGAARELLLYMPLEATPLPEFNDHALRLPSLTEHLQSLPAKPLSLHQATQR